MKFAKGGGGCLVLLGICFFFLALFMFADPPDGDTRLQALVPGLFFSSVTLVPGILIFIWGFFGDRARAFEEQVAGLIRNHDRFTVGEMAKKIGKNELETEVLISRLSVRQKLDLVYHRPTREYLHRGLLDNNSQIVDRCPSCGGSVGRQVVFRGESVQCSYCGAALVKEGT